jgi:hypothetical protein
LTSAFVSSGNTLSGHCCSVAPASSSSSTSLVAAAVEANLLPIGRVGLERTSERAPPIVGWRREMALGTARRRRGVDGGTVACHASMLRRSRARCVLLIVDMVARRDEDGRWEGW